MLTQNERHLLRKSKTSGRLTLPPFAGYNLLMCINILDGHGRYLASAGAGAIYSVELS